MLAPPLMHSSLTHDSSCPQSPKSQSRRLARPLYPRSPVSRSSFDAQFLLLDTRQHPRQRNDRSHNHRPQLHMKHILIEVRLRRSTHGGQRQRENNIAAHAMVFIQRLGIVHTPVESRGVILRNPDNSLNAKEDVRDEAENGVGRNEMIPRVGDFVVLDDDQTSNEGQDARDINGGVDVGAPFLLLGGVGWLEDEDGLGDEEDAGGVQKLLRAKEGQRQ